MHRTFVSQQHQQSGSALGQKQDYCRRCVININSWTSRSLTTIGQQKTCEVSRRDIRQEEIYSLGCNAFRTIDPQLNSKY